MKIRRTEWIYYGSCKQFSHLLQLVIQKAGLPATYVCRTGRINHMRKTPIGLIGVFAVVISGWGQTLRPVTTRAFDNSRSGANTSETILTRDNLVAKGIRRVTTIPVYGDARGTESQPLILPGVRLKDGSTHDVMILPSMANMVRGVDAETGAGLWQTNLGRPVIGARR